MKVDTISCTWNSIIVSTFLLFTSQWVFKSLPNRRVFITLHDSLHVRRVFITLHDSLHVRRVFITLHDSLHVHGIVSTFFSYYLQEVSECLKVYPTDECSINNK